MEHTIDDTAKAILGSPRPKFVGYSESEMVNESARKCFDQYQDDLQALAKLWLMREELHEAIKAAYRFDDGCYSGYPDTEADRVKVTDALAKLAELEK